MAFDSGRPKISVLINTLNEEKNLPYALRSVKPWADEIVVVDMYSEDRTVEIARDYGAKILFHDRVMEFDIARKYAIENASNEWMLILDADEIVPAPLSRRLLEIVSENKIDVVKIPYLNFLAGAPIYYSGWGPDQVKHFRLFRRGKLKIKPSVHNYIEISPGANVKELFFHSDGAIIHFSYLDFEHFITKLNRYTNIHALQAAKTGEQPYIAKALFRAARKFLAFYLLRKGYRDGWRGIYLALLMFFYEISTFAKLTQLQLVGSKEDIRETYAREAERYLSEYAGY